MTHILIRQADSRDAAIIAEFNLAMAAETEGLQLDARVVRNGVLALFDRPGLGFYLVAQIDDDVVACLMITTEWSDWRNLTFWWIQSVYVRPAFRRQGIYRSMYAFLQEMAERHDKVGGFRLYVERDNRLAQQAYLALGMSETPYRVFESVQPESSIHRTEEKT